MKVSQLIPYFYILLAGSLFSACAGPGNTTRYQPRSSNLVLNQDDEEHELIIIDNNFDRWFQINGRPINFYSLNYYESQNQRYVSAWNSLATRPNSFNSPFQNRIEYDYSEDYGLELNYKLFWYFRYIEDLYGRRYGFPI